jgi:2,3-bisphosphoglycerate-dependent phosphoglycerate mutase
MTERSLVLVRHGESQGNRDNVFTGWLDLPLTGNGFREAAAAGRLLRARGLVFGAVFTSALDRAAASCDALLGQCAAVPRRRTAASELNERDYGELAGLDKDAARARFGAETVQLWRRSYEFGPPGGESLRDTVCRVLPFYLHDILPAVMRSEGVLVVAHGNSLRALVMALDHLTPGEIEKVEIATGEIRIYRMRADTSVASREIVHASA